MVLIVGVLALQGGFIEHLDLLRKAAAHLQTSGTTSLDLNFIEVRAKPQLDRCDALVIPGGESTTMSIVAARTGLLEPLRDFVNIQRKPVWGSCAGFILLAKEANATKKGGQELIGGLDIRIQRNHFGRQTESFEADLDLAFLSEPDLEGGGAARPFSGVFIRAPIVEKILPQGTDISDSAVQNGDVVTAPTEVSTKKVNDNSREEVQVMGTLDRHDTARMEAKLSELHVVPGGSSASIVAVKQGNCFGTSFHPELTDDIRVHLWWLKQVVQAVGK